jgi:hypothetical protein
MRTTIAPCLLGLVSMVAMVTVEACAQIADIPRGQCGNAIVEEGEDCDTHARNEMACYPANGVAGKACRYDCSTSQCSGGYACGNDQVCRAASGQFQVVFGEPSAASSLLVADFDGDAQQDVCAIAKDDSAVYYLGPGLTVEQTTHVPVTVNGSPVAGSLTLDDPTSAAEIALLSGAKRNAVGVLRGREDRSFSATAYPSIPIPVPQAIVLAMDALVTLDGTEAMSLVRFMGRPPGAPSSTLMLLVGVDSLTPGDGSIFGLAELAEELPPLVEGNDTLIERVAVGQLDEDLLMSPCEEYVLAFRGEHLIRIGTPCRGLLVNGFPIDGPSGPPTDAQIATLVRHIVVDLPPPLSHGVADAHVFDLDGDGDLDVLISPDTEAADEARSGWAAYGPFHFDAPPALSPHVVAEPYPWLELSPDELLLAVARIDDDAAPDFVTSRGVFVSRNSGLPCPQADGGGGAGGVGAGSAGGGDGGGGDAGAGGAAPGDVHHCPAFAPALKANHFQHGVVGDFDGSGRTDVALASGNDAELHVYLGQKAGLVEHVISTGGPAHDLAVGDFDGDGFDDIGFAEDAVDGAVGDAVSVCFGRPIGPPEPPAGMGRLAEVEQIVSSTLRLANTTYADALDDLGVVSIADGELLTFAALEGSTDRLLQAPFYLYDVPPGADPDPDDTKTYRPSSLAIGDFAPDPSEHGDMAALALHRDDELGVSDRRLWLLEAVGDASLSQTNAWPGPEVVMPGWADGDELLIAVDIDGDRTDEVVGFGPLSDGGIRFGGALLLAQARPDPTLGPNGAFFDHVVIETQNGLVVGRVPPAPPVVADLDGDGDLDVITLGTKGLDTEAKPQLVVLYNRWSKDGSVAVLDALRIEDEAVFAAPPDTATFAVLQMDADKPLELVAFAADGAYVVEPAQGSTPERVADLPTNVRAAAAVDLDGDGLAELVLAGTELQIWRSSPVEP